MKNTLKRLLVAMLALVLLGSVMVPAAVAAEDTTLVPKASKVLEVYAGNKTTLRVYRNYVAMNPSLYRWRSSNTSIASVNSKGVVVGNKAGTVTITATQKSNGSSFRATVRVKRNKVDNLNPRPAVSAVQYKKLGIKLKSVEIVSPKRVDVEFYVVINYPYSWKSVSIEWVSEAINLFNLNSGTFYRTIVGGTYQVKSSKISGFKACYGPSVQVIKVTYSGAKVNCANVKLSQYRVGGSTNKRFKLRYYR